MARSYGSLIQDLFYCSSYEHINPDQCDVTKDWNIENNKQNNCLGCTRSISSLNGRSMYISKKDCCK